MPPFSFRADPEFLAYQREIVSFIKAEVARATSATVVGEAGAVTLGGPITGGGGGSGPPWHAADMADDFFLGSLTDRFLGPPMWGDVPVPVVVTTMPAGWTTVYTQPAGRQAVMTCFRNYCSSGYTLSLRLLKASGIVVELMRKNSSGNAEYSFMWVPLEGGDELQVMSSYAISGLFQPVIWSYGPSYGGATMVQAAGQSVPYATYETLYTTPAATTTVVRNVFLKNPYTSGSMSLVVYLKGPGGTPLVTVDSIYTAAAGIYQLDEELIVPEGWSIATYVGSAPYASGWLVTGWQTPVLAAGGTASPGGPRVIEGVMPYDRLPNKPTIT